METKSRVTRILFTSGLCLGLGSLIACSGQAQKTDLTFNKPHQDDKDAVPDSSKTKSSSSSQETEYGSKSGDTKASTPEPTTKMDPVVDETPSAPEPVTGSPTDSKMKEPGQLLNNAFFKIRNNGTKKCLIVHQGQSDAGRQIVQGPCEDPTAVFKLDFVDHKYYMISNKQTKLTIQIRDQIAMSAALIEQASYKARDHQKWDLVKEADGTFLIKSILNDTLCLDIAFASKDDNSAVQLWRECNQPQERWVFDEQD